MMMILTDKGLGALMDSQFKIGADASVAAATSAAGSRCSTTAAAGADIVTFARTRGLFAGIALEGSLHQLPQRVEPQPITARTFRPRQIVVAMEAHNPGADPLRRP